MDKTDQSLFLNLGCGFKQKKGFINVDVFEICKPDITHDLNMFPYPWDDNSVNGIEMWHTLEHLDDWWSVLLECVRILKVGGTLDIRVPDESSSSALTYRDHNHVFSQLSFHGIQYRSGCGTNAWAAIENDRVPLIIERYNQVPFPKYNWMTRWGFRWILVFCSNHLRNFIWEQQFHFRKIGNE